MPLFKHQTICKECQRVIYQNNAVIPRTFYVTCEQCQRSKRVQGAIDAMKRRIIEDVFKGE